MDYFGFFENENKTSKEIDEIVDYVSTFDVYDFIGRLAGLNLLSENQNKSVLIDSLIQKILVRPEEMYKSSIKMSDGRFKALIDRLNNTFLAAAVDPCENVFVQNVMLNSANYRVFNGIDITPAYNMQAIIRILFYYSNDFNREYLDKTNRLFSFILGVSEEAARNIDLKTENIIYNEEHRVIIPTSQIIKRNANCIRIPVERVVDFVDGRFELNEICSFFGEKEEGDINNRSFYTKPFLLDKKHNTLIVLNISLLPAFALFKAIAWADDYGIKEKVINRYNDYHWLESRRTLEKMGHRKINEKEYGIECVSNDYYKEEISTVYNNQLMLTFFICDDGKLYSEKCIHANYPDDRHHRMLNNRIHYYKKNLNKLGAHVEDIFIVIILSSIGRGLRIGMEDNPFFYKPITFNPFELHCLCIHERHNFPFLPRYIRAKSQLRTMIPNVFSELNAVCIYTSNNNSFYMNDDIDIDEMSVYIGSGDSIEYIAEALAQENRILIDSYDGNKTEVILADKVRNIYIENLLFPEKQVAFCIIFENIKLWIKTASITEYEQNNIYYSLIDAISYWLAECKSIIEMYDFMYDVYTIHISLTGNLDEFYYARVTDTSFEDSIDQTVEKNHIYLTFKPESFGCFNQENNVQEKEFIRYILDIFDNISYENREYSKALDFIFQNPLKKKFFAESYENVPYLKPLKNENHRIVHEEDEDYLSDIIGKELLKTGRWEIGIVEYNKRSEVAKEVVGCLYNRLKSMVADFEPFHMLEIIYQDLEETLYRLILAERRYYSDLACYPEKESIYLREYNSLNKTSLSLKFLVEYVTACPPSGTKHFGMGQYEELLGICSMIINWAYKGDLFNFDMVNTSVEFLKSKRIGMKRDEFIEMYQYSDMYRNRQLRYESSHALRKEYVMNTSSYEDELEMAFLAEFGYNYTEFVSVVSTMALFGDSDVICVSKTEVVSKLIEINPSLTKELIEKVLEDITYNSRNDYLVLPDGFDNEDAFPWRFNRKYSFNRRPVLQRGDELIWGIRQIYHMAEYLTDLIYSGKFNAKSDAMRTLCGKIVKERGNAFNDLIVEMIKDMNVFKVDSKVKKINGIRILGDNGDLGDIDALIIDEETGKIIVAEVKNFRFSRNPYEINQEYNKMFKDKASKPCYATKHNRRTKWVSEHMDDVKAQYGLGDRIWTVTSLFIVNQPLISQHIYKQKVKCISKAELSVEAIREV